MKIICGPRRSGKTTKLVEECMKDPQGIMIVSNYNMAFSIQDRFPKMRGLVFIPQDLYYRLRGKDHNLYVDEASYVERIYQTVKCVTITTNEDLQSFEVGI